MYKKMYRSILCFVLCVMICIFANISAFAAPVVTLGSFDLVDSGKHLDWDGNSNYMVQFTWAANTWNSLHTGVIRKDTPWIIEDVSISDYSGDNSTIVVVYSSGKVKFNQNVMDTQTAEQKKSDCLFALGIALGLGKTNNSADVMYQYTSSVTAFSENDKASYNAAYEKY